MTEQIDLNVRGTLFSWGHHQLTADGKKLVGFTSFSWGDKMDRPFGYGADKSRAPLGRGKGKYDPGTMKLKGYVRSIALLKLEHAKKSASGTVATEGEMLYRLQLDIGDGTPLHEFEFSNVVYLEDSPSIEEGADPTQREATLQPMRIREKIDGVWVALYDSSEDV